MGYGLILIFFANKRWEIFRFLSFVLLKGIGYVYILMAYSASPKPIGTVNLMVLFAYTLFAYTLFAFAMTLLAPPEFTAFAAFSFVRLSMYWHVRVFAYSAILYAFFCVPGTAPYP
jgi:predicted cobalt transporter CbtA